MTDVSGAASIGTDALGTDAVRVLAGNPSDEELAAVIAVLASVAVEAPTDATPAVSRASAWTRSQRPLRRWQHDATWS